MAYRDDNNDNPDTPGAGPSRTKKKGGRFEKASAKKKESLLAARRRELAELLEYHDGLVREVYHLETWKTLVKYDPEEAKQDRSTAFQKYQAQYDLVRNTQEDGSTTRRTRGATQGRMESLLIPPVQSLSSSRSLPPISKGKAKELPPPTTPSPKPTRRGPHRSENELHMDPRRSETSTKRHEHPTHTTPRSERSFRVPQLASKSPAIPIRIKLIRSTAMEPLSTTPDPVHGPGSLLSPSHDTPSRTGLRSAKHKAQDQPEESPRLLKRIKLIHNPRLDYSDPAQIPAKPSHGRSIAAYLDSYRYLDDDRVLDPDEYQNIDEIASAEARKRKRIEELRKSDVFEEIANKVDPEPPEEAKPLPTYQDHLVSHVVQLSKIYKEQWRSRVNGARRITKMIEKHFERAAGADERLQKEEERRRTLLVRATLKEVVREWKLAVSVIHTKKKEEEKAEQMRRGKQHLDAFLQQSSQVLEQQKSDLVAAMDKRRNTSRSSRASGVSSPLASSRASTRHATPDLHDDDIFPAGDGESMGNAALNDAIHAVEGGEELIFGSDLRLEEGAEMDLDSLDPLIPEGPDGHLGLSGRYSGQHFRLLNGHNHIPSSPSPHSPVLPGGNLVQDVGEAEVHRTLPFTNGFHVRSVDDDFEQNDTVDLDSADQRMAEEMEAEEDEAVDESDGSEIEGLGTDAEIPVAELLRRYGYPVPDIQDEQSIPQMLSPPRAERPNEVIPVSNSRSEDDDFRVDNSAALNDADHQLDVEMETEELGDSDQGEIDGLAEDASLPVEELLRRYNYGDGKPNSDIQVNGEADGLEVPLIDRKDSTTAVNLSPRSPLDLDTRGGSVALGDSASATPPILALVSEAKAQRESGDMEEAEADSGVDEDVDSGGDDESATSSTEDEDAVDDEDGSVKKIPPPFLLRGTLRPYQQAGLEWLAALHSNKTNGILADEMGLGKTIQTIALLGYLACSQGIWGPHLIIVPTSVLLNWEMEFKRFLPGFRTLSYYGTQKERREKRQGWTSPHAFNVCITSYQLALADQQVFRRKKWVYMILDEAHNIKNFKSKRWETLLCFNAQHRLLLTGTPLQNNLMELWSLLYFLMPDEGFSTEAEDSQLFVRRQDFKDLFQNPVERAIESGQSLTDETKDTVQKLHTLLRPYLLRRLKAEVEQQLPGKHEHIVYCKLSKRQRFLYDEFMSRATTRETLTSGNFLSIVNCLMQLRKVCNHPDLFEVRPIVTSFAMPRSAIADYEITELLVRRRLLADLDDGVELATPGLQITQYEPVSLLAARSTRRLDASPRFPHVPDLPGEPPPLDTRTIAGWRAYREYQHRASTAAKWKHLAHINHSRCSQHVIYSSELLHKVGNLVRPLVPLNVAEKDRRRYMGRLDSVHKLVLSHEERLQAAESVIDRFAFATPAVTARGLPLLALPGPASTIIKQTSADLEFDTLHRPAVKLQIAFPDASLIQYDCGKLQELDALLRLRAAGGHRVLIFTQMTRVLDILEIFLNFRGYRYLRLDGTTKVEQRQIITERFNVDSRIFAFIASSRSGGVGINLTGADTVIFYDSDYNPAMDRQCEDRAHRIGQTREVHIYRFISSHTVEEAMLRKANQKRSLDDMVIQKGEFDWRKMLADELEAGSGGNRLEEALALVEDKEDAEAARLAVAEMRVDQAVDFDDNPTNELVADPVSVFQEDEESDTDEGVADGEVDDVGTVAEYMLRMVERDWEFFGFEKPYSPK